MNKIKFYFSSVLLLLSLALLSCGDSEENPSPNENKAENSTMPQVNNNGVNDNNNSDKDSDRDENIVDKSPEEEKPLVYANKITFDDLVGVWFCEYVDFVGKNQDISHRIEAPEVFKDPYSFQIYKDERGRYIMEDLMGTEQELVFSPGDDYSHYYIQSQIEPCDPQDKDTKFFFVCPYDQQTYTIEELSENKIKVFVECDFPVAGDPLYGPQYRICKKISEENVNIFRLRNRFANYIQFELDKYWYRYRNSSYVSLAHYAGLRYLGAGNEHKYHVCYGEVESYYCIDFYYVPDCPDGTYIIDCPDEVMNEFFCGRSFALANNYKSDYFPSFFVSFDYRWSTGEDDFVKNGATYFLKNGEVRIRTIPYYGETVVANITATMVNKNGDTFKIVNCEIVFDRGIHKIME